MISLRVGAVPCAALVASYFALALFYSWATAPFEAGDERLHFYAVRDIARGQGLPVLRPFDPRADSPRQEAGQPPLYYLAAALTFIGLNTDDVLQLAPNEAAAVGLPSTNVANRNSIIHPPDEERLESVIALRRARLLSIVLGALAVLATYWLAVHVAPAVSAVPPLAAALVGFNPMFLFVSASVSNDSAIAAISTVALLALVPTLSWQLAAQHSALQGILVGAAACAKLSGLALVPLALHAVGFVAWRQRRWRGLFLHGGALLGGVAVMAGWWYARNVGLYGDPTGLRYWLALVGMRSQPFDFEELRGAWIAYWGVFGAFNILAPGWTYAAYAGLCFVSAAGWLMFLTRRQVPGNIPALALVAAWTGTQVVALGWWISLNMASSGRLLFAAIGCFSIVCAIGLLGPLPRRLQGVACGLLITGLATTATLIPLISIVPAYR